MKKQVIGHIECPSCVAGAGKMQITADKNGDPFGYCIECGQQLRVGPNKERVDMFRARYGIGAAHGVVDAVSDHAPVPAPVPESRKADEAAKVAKRGGFKLGGL